MTYAAPIADIRFALDAAADLWRLRGAFPDLDEDLLGAILGGVDALAVETLAPLNASGDRAGARLENGRVHAAAGFGAAYAAFVEGGWQGLAAAPAFGGQGLPKAVALAVHEAVHAANMAFGLAPMLTLGAIEALQAHGSPEQQALYLPKLVSGEWSGTMNLTEPLAGSDVGALVTKAAPAADGAFRITGQKIFITWGDHDMTDNIVHLVLARLPDAPAGAKGVSLFLAPRTLPDGTDNGVRCLGIERKMGIHASPTCTMGFDNTLGWLVGAPNAGLACMFTMMNSARLNVGLQGVAVAEAACQKAVAYAQERRQGHAEGALSHGPSAIVDHADVRRMLLTMRAKIQAGRAICYATAVAADLATHDADEDSRRAARAREDILTPIAKSWCTDMATEVTSLAVQVHGGMGFVEDGGVAQFYRDARIGPIYEGTNGIQAIDLIGRKLGGDRGAAMMALIGEAKATAQALREGGQSGGARIGPRLADAADALGEATAFMLACARPDALAGASAYLTLAGDVAGAMLVAQGLLRADTAQAARQAPAALYFAETVLPGARGRLPAIMLGADLLEDPIFRTRP